MSSADSTTPSTDGKAPKSPFRIFRKKDDSVVRKSKGFKRIRGLLSGESRKERRERKAKERAAKQNAPLANKVEEDDASTIYNVDVEERSTATSKSGASTISGATGDSENKKTYMLKVVLLLMDPESRRFELLQLEFDSLKALVSDVLAQIPVSVTEEALRKQTYTAICGQDEAEMSPDKLLATFCKGNDVLVAIPAGMPVKECARLARPILSDDKVVSMLLSSGIDAKAWREKKAKSPKAKFTETPEEPDVVVGSPSSSIFTFIFVVFFAILLQVFHLYISAPIRPGHVVSPGIWLTKCGVLPFLPTCEKEYVTFDKDGLVSLYDKDDELVWEIQGGVCEEGDESCVAGMHFNEDLTLEVGGKHISSVKMHKEGHLSPWPFAEEPKVKVKHPWH